MKALLVFSLAQRMCERPFDGLYFAGHESTACERLDDTTLVIRYATTGPAACTAVFLLLYFFGMASCLWWVVLTFTWFLAAGLKWGQEAIAAHAHYFHLVAWVVPAVQTATALALAAVDGDPVSGICYVGNQNVANLRGFVLGPLCAYLLFGTCFLVAGFVAMFRVRRVIRRRQLCPVPGGADKLDRFVTVVLLRSTLNNVATVIIDTKKVKVAHIRLPSVGFRS